MLVRFYTSVNKMVRTISRVRVASLFAFGGVFLIMGAAVPLAYAATTNSASATSSAPSTTSTSTAALADATTTHTDATSTGDVVLASAEATSSSSSSATSTASTTLATSSAVSATHDTCGVSAKDIARIAAIQHDASFTPSQEVIQELAVRQALVAKVITCAQGEVTQLQSLLKNASTSTPTAQAIQSQLEGRVHDAENFYSLEFGKLATAGIAGTKQIAAEVLSWRTGTYVPLTGEVHNFLLWNANQALFSTAQTRMDQTQQAVSFLENASENANLQKAFDAAYASFRTAKQDNVAAAQALQQSASPNRSLALIKQSLDALQGTYNHLFTVSDIVQKLLPQ